MASLDLYTEAHLVVAAIRVLEHQKKAPPSINDICDALNISIEHGNRICRKLFEISAIKLVESTHGLRVFITDHLKIEDIPKGKGEDKLNEELKLFQQQQKQISQKVESIQAQQTEKKKNLFAELEKKLKKETQKP
jgi:hypothetical protein